MLRESIQISPENSRYIQLISFAFGITWDEVVNAALDEKRAKDADTLQKIKNMTGQLWQPGKLEEPALAIQAAETPEKPKRHAGGRPRKKSVNDVAREIEETEREGKMKMSRDEFVDYFSIERRSDEED